MLSAHTMAQIVEYRKGAPDDLAPEPPNPPGSVLGKWHPHVTLQTYCPESVNKIFHVVDDYCKQKPIIASMLLNAAYKLLQDFQQKYQLDQISIKRKREEEQDCTENKRAAVGFRKE